MCLFVCFPATFSALHATRQKVTLQSSNLLDHFLLQGGNRSYIHEGNETCVVAVSLASRTGGSLYRFIRPVLPRIIMVTYGVLTEKVMAVDEKELRNIVLERSGYS